MDREARHQIVDLADLLHTFGRRTKAREMELWGRDVPAATLATALST